jgi:hypothetical protein
MAINPLSFPQYSIDTTVDPGAWSSLANLGNVARSAQEERMKQQALSNLGADPAANAQWLIASKVPSLVTLGLNLQQRGVENTRAQQELAIRQAQEDRAAAADEARTKGEEGLPGVLGGLFNGTAAPPGARAPVAPSPTVWGDKEAEAKGLYPTRTAAAGAAPGAAPAAGGAYPQLPVYDPAQASPFETGELGGGAVPGQPAAAPAPAAAPVPARVQSNVATGQPASTGISSDEIRQLAANPLTRPMAIALATEKLQQASRRQQAVAAGFDPSQPNVAAWIATAGGLSVPTNDFVIEKVKGLPGEPERLVRVPKSGPAGPIDLPPAPGSTGVDNSTLTGEDYLKTLPPARASIVRGVLDLSIDPNKLSIVGGHREGILADAKQADPTYDAALAPAKFAATKEFIAGGPNSPASTIVSGGTTIGHLLHASDVSQRLGGPSGYGPATGLINQSRIKYLEQQNDPDLKEYNTILGRIAEEGTKFYRGVGGTESDIERDIASMTPAQAQAARDRGLATQASAMYSKVQALQDRWKNALGPRAWNRISQEQNFPVISRANIAAVNTILQRGGLPPVPVPDDMKAPVSGLGSPADAMLEDARLALAHKVPREQVIDRLRKAGIDERLL